MTKTLGKYELREVLGKGAMGTVYEGFDPVIARRVAIKTVRLPAPDDVEAQEELTRFKREAQAAGRLSHPNIVGVFDYGETPELAYIVMEFVDGTTLKHVMDNQERFELGEIVRIMEALMAGLQFSHDRGVVHRDIKPANVMLTKSGEVKIADFGIARIESSSMTQAGTMLGTPSYMSPEQFMGQTVDARTDLYSVGVMLYQMLTGEKPFEGGLTAIMHKVLNTEPPLPSALSVTVTPAFDAVVRKAMAKRPEARFASASEFAAALREALVAKPETGEISLAAMDFADGEATMVTSRLANAAPPPAVSAPVLSPAASAAAPGGAQKSPNFAWLGGGAVLALVVLGGGAYLALGSHAHRAASVPAAPVFAAPPPAMTAAELDARLTATLSSVSCTLLSAEGSGAVPVLTGLVGAGAPQAALTAALKFLPNSSPFADRAETIDGPYCNVLDAIRPYHPLFGVPSQMLGLNLAGGKTTLHNGDLITVDETMPAYAGYLQTDYFSSDGTVLHLYPTPADPLQPVAAGGSKILGDPTHGGARWQVSAPYGTDLILSIASSQPLFPTVRSQEENASDYLPALRAALQNAASSGEKLSIAALPVVTLPKAGQ